MENLVLRRPEALPWRVAAGVLISCALAAAIFAVHSIVNPRLAPVSVVLLEQRGAATAPLRLQPAVTRYQWWRGLQGRRRLPARTGMLFDFGQPSHVCLWMLHTPMALQAMFFDASHRLVASALMSAESLKTHCPRAPVQYAIELAPGVADVSEIKGFRFGNY